MVLDAVAERFLKHSQITAMARLALQRVLEPDLDRRFVRAGARNSVHARVIVLDHSGDHVAGRRGAAALGACDPALPVSITALYDRISRTEPGLFRALVQGSAGRLGPVVQPLLRSSPASMRGYRVRIVDDSHSPTSEKRLKPLRGFRGAALPGQSMVVYGPDTAMIVDLVLCEDAHAQERAIMETLLE
ncbi:hypothetical protein ACU4GI_11785 [Cupriavidus basilensis]